MIYMCKAVCATFTQILCMYVCGWSWLFKGHVIAGGE